MHYAITLDKKSNFVTTIGEAAETYSDIDSLITHVLHSDSDAVFIRDDRMMPGDDGAINALHDFDSMSRDEMRHIHARAHSRRNAFRECAYCVRDFISPDDFVDETEAATFVRPINSRMSHDACSHEKTKNARAKCRRERRNADKTERADDGMEIVTIDE